MGNWSGWCKCGYGSKCGHESEYECGVSVRMSMSMSVGVSVFVCRCECVLYVCVHICVWSERCVGVDVCHVRECVCVCVLAH